MIPFPASVQRTEPGHNRPISRSRVNIAAGYAAVAVAVGLLAGSPPARAQGASFQVPDTARELIVVSSATYHPPGYLATFRAYVRTSAGSAWRLVIGPWEAETGYSGFRDSRHEGDGSTPTGVFGIGLTLYGTAPDPGGLHYRYHHLVCGDWWDSDPYTRRYNQFVHVRCGVTPRFASAYGTEGLWTETVAYPHFAVIGFNVDPTTGGRRAPGSGIFLHSWVHGPTAGCVALPPPQLLAVLRWLRPSDDPVIEIGTKREVGPLP